MKNRSNRFVTAALLVSYNQVKSWISKLVFEVDFKMWSMVYLYKTLCVCIGKKLVFVYERKKKLSTICNISKRNSLTVFCIKYN